MHITLFHYYTNDSLQNYLLGFLKCGIHLYRCIYYQGRTGFLNLPGNSHHAGLGPCNKEQQVAITANTKIIEIGVRGAVY